MSHNKSTDRATPRTGDWVERYMATGGDTDPSEDWVRETIEYPRRLLQFAREAAADQPEDLRDLATRAMAEEVRRLAFTYPPPKRLMEGRATEEPPVIVRPPEKR